MANETGKAQYESPELTVHGTFESLTQGFATGIQLDASFPSGTPVVDLTFS
jgi:hypothetical protein